ncbi:hypothetical protein MMC28_003598 [Mycoblastus sanguinarius]|nr:hypothetical protein [Mycoblastus sanguinarius]
MLERQHVQLIAAVQELYRRVQTGQGWQGPRLEKVKYDRPLTHKILEELGVLQIDEWDEVNGSGAGWNTLEHQTPNDGFTYTSILNTPSTQTTFLPSTQEAFPNSTLIARRRMKSLGALTPGQTLSMPPLDTNFPSTATAGTFNAGVAYQLSLPFNVDNNINLGHTREIGVDMDCMVGITDLFDYSGGPGLLSVP